VTIWLQSVEICGDECPVSDRYPFNIIPLQGRKELRFTSVVSFFVGENGSGKSTFVQALARACGLHNWGQPKRALAKGELPATALSPQLRVVWTEGPVSGGLFSAESFREWAEFLDDVARLDPGQAIYHGGAGLTAKSHGEGILAYFRGRYRVPGLYLLDEPESALSPASQVDLLRLLDAYRSSGHAQFVIATHSPILMALPESQIFHFSDAGIAEVPYEATEHLRLYRAFLEDPKSFLP
jgi:predicted ATPase